MEESFSTVFTQATGFSPYPYQEALAQKSWPDVLEIPTGLGKTAAIILAWCFKRLQYDNDTPRRLIYTLPTRVLVEQTVESAKKWVERIAPCSQREHQPQVYKIMGGAVEIDWEKKPEESAILIGTQDQLLSRALNHGFATSRFKWPIHFALLHNDALWVMDEIQLMGPGLATTTQLEAFRRSMSAVFPSRSLWMSATLHPSWLNSFDFAMHLPSLQSLALGDKDTAFQEVRKRITAKKLLSFLPLPERPKERFQVLAERVLEHHRPGTRTLVILNTVQRAQELYKRIKAMLEKNCSAGSRPDLCLIHSRFRPPEKERALALFLRDPSQAGTVAVSTQVIEAGVDVTSSTLFTELAPWSSLVQRMGRCNRYGEEEGAFVFWLDLEENTRAWYLPYTAEALDSARAVLQELEGRSVAPAELPQIEEVTHSGHVLRRKDLIELFDTSTDLMGFDPDINRYIRETDEKNLFVFWREVSNQGPERQEPEPNQQELCSAPVGIIDQWVKKNTQPLWVWDYLEEHWARASYVSPGMTVLLPVTAGGYSDELGWTGNKKHRPFPCSFGREEMPEGVSDDPLTTSARNWKSLLDHTEKVCETLKHLLDTLALKDKDMRKTLLTASLWHDVGKAHPVFQAAAVGEPPQIARDTCWAKSALGRITYSRRGFRHELASALALLENENQVGLSPEWIDLAAYLVAAHHGRIRLTIRSLPHEASLPDPVVRQARGIRDGDQLPETRSGRGFTLPPTVLRLDVMDMGVGPHGPSWTERTESLLQRFGPFRLVYLEALLRVADWRASAGE